MLANPPHVPHPGRHQRRAACWPRPPSWVGKIRVCERTGAFKGTGGTGGAQMPVLPHCFRALGPHTASRIQSCSAYERRTFDCASAGGSTGLAPTAPKPTSDRLSGPGKGKGVLHVFFSPSWEPSCLNSEPHRICAGGGGLSQLLAQGNGSLRSVLCGVGRPLA